MSNLLNNALTGIRASQAALTTTSNNVANAATEGYSRQRVNLVEQPSAPGRGGLVIGNGVKVAGVERVYDNFLANSLQTVTMSEGRAQVMFDLSQRLDGLLGNPDLAIGDSVQRFFDQAEILNQDATSPVARRQLITEGETLVERFRQLDTQLNTMSNEVDLRLRDSISTANRLAADIAEINLRITTSSSDSPNDLLDQRELLLKKLGNEIDYTVVRQNNGSVNVLIGSGQPLVLASQSFELALQQNEFDGARLELAYDDGNTLQSITDKIGGGKLAGLLDFRDEALGRARNDLGMVALGITEAFNAQHREGMDLNGSLGGDFFSPFGPRVTASAANTGTGSVNATVADATSVQPREYLMRYDGATWQFFDAANGAVVTPTGTGTGADPFVIDGLEITVAAGAAAGDKFVVQPVKFATGEFVMSINDPAKIAAAGPVSATRSLANLSNTTIAPPGVNDVTDANLLQTVDIVFDDATTFRIFDTGGTDLTGPIAYVDGGDISYNGWTTQILGTPEAGDTFRLASTGGNSGDNRNAIELAQVASAGYFAGGQLSLANIGANLVANVGSVAARSSHELSTQSALREQVELEIESVSGVNLDEEAVNLLKYQEAYMAASRVISVANQLFQNLLNELG
ncbi:MAG: flagellar hook-associated protein FlgK [Gammaproteobacteria bacterium]|nr:flagellar hook-associated protein FlgK [Gammaproteobacteria bacterium]